MIDSIHPVGQSSIGKAYQTGQGASPSGKIAPGSRSTPISTNRPPHRTACITGATSGIGKAFAQALSNQGWSLILTGRRREVLEDFAKELSRNVPRNPPVRIVLGDLRESETREQLMAVLRETPGLELLIHNAGYGLDRPFLEASPEDVLAMGELHVQCTTFLVNQTVPLLSGQSSVSGQAPGIILVSSAAAFLPSPGPALYTATKAFIVSLGIALFPELSRRNIALQVLCPGFTRTDFHARLGWHPRRLQNRGLIRWMDPRKVAELSLRRLWNGPLGLHRRSPVYIPGLSNRLILRLARLIPRRIYTILARSW
ncbi:SDR family NAD(P)-dependent oxidoreductase [Alkalispirochaeta americana]|uniref:SDR family NAD(P)-dependent oxidoreductase n=1 Tax=Alkalispirochaeta americana TaxID=159291 RepID=UPI0013564792|nr:SDR family NAD(P)-dependent oxidoreductase [Alkalispirochaeta americana]